MEMFDKPDVAEKIQAAVTAFKSSRTKQPDLKFFRDIDEQMHRRLNT